MKLLSVLFWALVITTAGVSYRWGNMVALIFFLFALVIGAAIVSHWAPA
jgi:hypothetical protein